MPIGPAARPNATRDTNPTAAAPTRNSPIPARRNGLPFDDPFVWRGAVGGGGAGASSVRYTQATGSTGDSVSTGTSNFGLALCRVGGAGFECRLSGSFLGGIRISCLTTAFRGTRFNVVDQAAVIVRGAAPRRIFPYRLMAGRRVIQIDALPDSRAEHVLAQRRVLLQRLQRCARGMVTAVHEHRQYRQQLQPPLRPQFAHLQHPVERLPRANH